MFTSCSLVAAPETTFVGVYPSKLLTQSATLLSAVTSIVVVTLEPSRSPPWKKLTTSTLWA